MSLFDELVLSHSEHKEVEYLCVVLRTEVVGVRFAKYPFRFGSTRFHTSRGMGGDRGREEGEWEACDDDRVTKVSDVLILVHTHSLVCS